MLKKADKGSAMVVMKTTDYLKEGYRQLSDVAFYTQIQNDPTIEVSQRITKALAIMKNKGLISEDNFEYLMPNNTTIDHFHLLPRIHKKNITGRLANL